MLEHHDNKILNGVIWKQLLIFFFPIMLGTLFQQLYNTADVAIVGRYAGKLALAAVGGPSALIINLLINFFVGLCSGATVVVAQVYGSGDEKRLSTAIHTAMWMGLVLGGALSVVGYFVSEWILVMMGTPEEMLGLSASYLKIYFTGTVFTFVYNMGTSVLRAVGDSRRPFWVLVAATTINVALDLLFIVTFGWGVAGAASATVLSQAVSAAGVVFFMVREEEVPPLRLAPLMRPNFTEIHNVVRIGFPAGIQSAMYSISNICIQSCINTLGVDTVAAWATYSKVDRLYWSVTSAFTIALATFAGQNFGARKYDRVYSSMRSGGVLALIYTLAFSSLYIAFGDSINGLFTEDPEVIRIAGKIVWMMVPWYVLYVPIDALAGGMRGTGDSLVPMVATIIGVCGFRLMWIWCVVPFNYSLHTILTGYPISWGLTATFFIYYYYRGDWMERSIERRRRCEKNRSF